MNTAALNSITLSIVSHGHGPMVTALLQDLSRLPIASRALVVLTLNLPSETFDVQDFPALRIEIIQNPRQKGFGPNHNAAFRHVAGRTDWFVILNPDLRLPEDPFVTLLEAAKRHPEVAALAPRIESSQGKPEDAVRVNLSLLSLIRRSTGDRHAEDVRGPATLDTPFYWLAGMFLMVRADDYAQLGGFDERFFMYCEDYDLCARLYISGRGLLSVQDCQAIHDAQRNSHRSRQHLKWHLRSLLRVWTSFPFWRIALRIGSGR
jgi:N-acetylglucosaminyl-diphospho-decaprenol L-rhamnosyltransferase